MSTEKIKTCKDCTNTFIPVSDRQQYCASCGTAAGKYKRYRKKYPERVKKAAKNWRDNNKEYNVSRQRSYHLKYKFNITEQDYENLLIKQNNKCAICGTDKPTGKWKVFAVDHCHKTGKVRGLLCNECNRGMGLLKDSVVICLQAAAYLFEHEQENNLCQ